MKKGDKFLVTSGEYQGMILTVRTIRYEMDDSPLYFPNEDLKNGEGIHFSENEIREWTNKDNKIKMKFHKLFQTISDNKTTLIARAAKDKEDTFVRNLIEKHQESMMVVKEMYERFLYERLLSKEDINKLNEIWRKEYRSIEFYANPKWVYPKNLPHNFTPKFADEDIKTQWRIMVGMNVTNDVNAHAVMYSSGV